MEARNKHSFSANDGDIEICSTYTYLGVLFTAQREREREREKERERERV